MEIARNDLSWLEIEDFRLPQYMAMEELRDQLEVKIADGDINGISNIGSFRCRR